RDRENRRGVDEADGIAVGRRRRERREADFAASAGAVDDHDLRAATEVLLHVGRERPRDEVGAAAGRERDDQGDRALGIRRGCRLRQEREQYRNQQSCHRSPFSELNINSASRAASESLSSPSTASRSSATRASGSAWRASRSYLREISAAEAKS